MSEKIRSITVRMGEGEYQSNTDMRQIAKEIIDTYMPLERTALLVEVIEHAGWHEDFAMINGEIRCVNTANDTAVYPDDVVRFWQKYGRNDTEWDYLPTVVRPSIAPQGTPAIES